MALSLRADSLDFVHATRTSGPPRIGEFGSRKVGLGVTAERLARDLRLERYQCATLLAPGEYQMFTIESPEVPPAELRNATRWRIKDMVDYPVDQATLDVLDIPREDSAGTPRHFMFAVAAQNKIIEARMREFESARIPLSVIDIQETSQRNIAALCEPGERGIALVYFSDVWGLFTISYGGELFLARRLEVGLTQLASPDAGTRQDALDRVALELQRTLDHFERQFTHVPIAKLMVGPTPQDPEIFVRLRSNLSLSVESLDLGELLAFDAGKPDAMTQWRLFHHFGAALRTGPLQ